MRYLLDTVALLMWLIDPDRLGRRAHEVIATREAPLYLSSVSVWEIANKNRIGKLPQVQGFERAYPDLLRSNGFAVLPLDDRHAMRAGYLGGEHRDPFDRLLAGQALIENLVVLTNDPEIARFGCEVLW